MRSFSIILSLFVLISSVNIGYSQCPTDDLILLSQSDVDQFAIDFPTCSIISGNLHIGYDSGLTETNISDLSPLSDIVSINGDLIIRKNPQLDDLNGLAQIPTTNNLTIEDNDKLSDLEGLNAISEINNDFKVINNDSLVSFTGLSGLTMIEGNTSIIYNQSLESFSGLDNLEEIGGSLEFIDNPVIMDMMGLGKLNIIASFLIIQANDGLTTLNGLNNLLTIGGQLFITENDNLSTCTAPAICNYMENNSASAFVENNAQDCNTIEEIETACDEVNCIINYSTLTTHSTCGGANGSIIISDIVGTGPFEYLWSTGDTTASLTDIEGGIYHLTITDIIDCSYTETFAVDSSMAISYDAMIEPMTCGMNNGYIVLNNIVGAQPISILWEDGTSSDSITNLSVGFYSFTLTDASGCTLEDSIEIDAVTIVNANISATEETAEGANDGTASVFPSEGLPPYSVLWSTGDTTTSIENLIPQIYYVTVTDAIGCEVYDQINVPIFSCNNFETLPQLTPASCFNACDGSISINASGGTPPYTYTWTDRPDTTSNISDLCFGIYYYQVTDIDGCVASGGVTVFQGSEIGFDATVNHESYLNENDGSINIDTVYGGNPGYTFLWSTGDSTSNIMNLAPGEYYITISDSNQCSVIDTFSIDEGSCIALETYETIVNDGCTPTCRGSISIDSISNGEGPFVYAWSNNSTTSAIDSLCEGTYTVTITGNDDCIFVKDYTITQGDSLIASTYEIFYETGISTNDAQIIVEITDGVPPYLFGWSTGDTTLILDSIGAGEYEYVISDDTGCFYSNTVTVPEFDCNNFTLSTSSTPTSCYGSTEGTASFIGINNLSHYDSLVWSNGSTDSLIENMMAGDYFLSLHISSDCVVKDTLTIDQNDPIIINIESMIQLTDSSQASIQVSSENGIGENSYEWSGPNEFHSTDPLISLLEIGCYTLIVTDTLGCNSTIDSLCIEDQRVGVNNIDLGGLVSLYPNPAENIMQISFDNSNLIFDDAHQAIYSISGRQITPYQKMTNKIDVSSLENGIYLLKINTKSGVGVYKFVVER